MSNKLIVKRSAVPGRVPTIAQLEAAELAVNTADQKIYFGSGGEVHEIAKKSDIESLAHDHGELTGLTDDDHSQYVHISNNRTITAQHIIAPTSVQAPFVLGANAQGQKVNGLNVDLLDGLDSTAFVLASNVGTQLATLGADGKLTQSQVPSIAITDTYVVNSESEMLALAATIGTVAIRMDQSTSYILAENDATLLASWQELVSPTDGVTSVNGQQGAVTLDTGDLTEAGNLFFTIARARNSISVAGHLSYNETTGTISYTAPVTSVAGKSGGAVVLDKNDVGLSNVDNKSSITIRSEITAANVTTALGYTPQNALGYTAENTANKNVSNGYAGLDAQGHIDSSSLNAQLITGALAFTPEDEANKNQADGYAGLDSNGKLFASQLPAIAASPIGSIFSGNVAQQSGSSVLNPTTTAPTNTQGTQIVSQVVAPSSNTAKVIIDFAGMVDTSTNNATVNIAVFRGTTFIGISSSVIRTAGQVQPFALKIVDVPGTTANVTYTFRIGVSSGSWYLGRSQSNTFGGVNPSGWSITMMN